MSKITSGYDDDNFDDMDLYLTLPETRVMTMIDPDLFQQYLNITRFRMGQLMYNNVRLVNPQLAGMVVNSDWDPYYDDTRIPAFLKFIEKHWDD